MSKPKLSDYIHPDDPLFKALDKSLDGIYIGAHQPVADIITHVLAERDGAALRELRVARQMLREADDRSCREKDGLCSSPWCNGNHHDSACEGDYMTRRVLEGIDELLARQPQETPAPNDTAWPAAAPATAPTAGVTEATIDEWLLRMARVRHEPLAHDGAVMDGSAIMRTLLAERDEAQQKLAEARSNADFLRESVGECHLMISRNTPDFQMRKEWDSTDLPPRLQRVMQDRDALKAEVERLRAEQQRFRAIEAAARALFNAARMDWASGGDIKRDHKMISNVQFDALLHARKVMAAALQPAPAAPAAETPRPSLIQMNYDNPGIVPAIVEAIDTLDSRVEALERERKGGGDA